MRTDIVGKKGSTSTVYTVLGLALLIVFLVIGIIIILNVFSHSLNKVTVPGVNASTAPCQLLTQNISTSRLKCDFLLTAINGQTGLVYALYNNSQGTSQRLCSYVAGYTNCRINVTIIAPETFLCNTTGSNASSSGTKYGPGGEYQLTVSC